MFSKSYSFFGTNIKVESESEKALKLANKCIDYFSLSREEKNYSITIKIIISSLSVLEERRKIIDEKFYLFAFDRLKGYRIGKHLVVTDGVSIVECETDSGCVNMFLEEKMLSEDRFFSFVFFYLILMEMLRYCGFYYAHSSCIFLNGKSLLIPGDTGSGKTTLCITLLREGYRYLSDDGVLLKREGDNIRVLALPGEFHIDPLISTRFKELESVKEGEKYGKGPKRAFSANDIYPDQFVSDALQRFIIFPEITDAEESCLQKLSGADALALFIPHSLLVMMDKEIAPLHLETLKRTVEISDSYRLKSGRDLLDNPANVVSMIKKNLLGEN